MGFFSGIKRLFGFDSDGYIEEEDEDGEVSYVSSSSPVPAPPETGVKNQDAQVNPDDLVIPDAALEKLVTLLNASQPEYVRSCLDKEAQKKYICEAMGDSFKNFTSEIRDKVIASERAAWTSYKNKSEEEIRKCNTTISEQKTKIDEVKAQLLSSERQRRALKESAQDMEKKVSECEAEVEQFNLEIQSLKNKLKVEQVKSGDLDYFKNENSRLLAELNKAKVEALKKNESGEENSGNAAKAAELEARIASLTEKNAGLESEKNALAAAAEETKAAKEKLAEENENLRKQNEETAARIGTLESEAAEKNTALEAREQDVKDLKAELAMAVKMVDDFRTQTAKAQADAESARQTAAAAAKTPVVDEAALKEAHEKLKLANEEIESLREQVEEADENSRILEQIEVEFEKIEKQRKEEHAKLGELTEAVKQKDIENLTLRNENAALSGKITEKEKEYSQTIKKISDMYEEQIKTLRNEEKKQKEIQSRSIDVDAMESTLADVFAPMVLDDVPAKYADAEPVEPVELEALDLNEDFGDDWLQPTPPTPPAPKAKPEPEEEPKPDNRRDDDRLQMSLF